MVKLASDAGGDRNALRGLRWRGRERDPLGFARGRLFDSDMRSALRSARLRSEFVTFCFYSKSDAENRGLASEKSPINQKSHALSG